MAVIPNLDEFILEETADGIFLTVTGDDEQTLKLKVTLDDLEEIVEVIDEVFGLEEDDGETEESTRARGDSSSSSVRSARRTPR